MLRPMRPNPLMPTFTAIVPPEKIQAAQNGCDADGKLKIVTLRDSAAQMFANDDAPRASVIQTQHAQMDAGPSPQKEKSARRYRTDRTHRPIQRDVRRRQGPAPTGLLRRTSPAGPRTADRDGDPARPCFSSARCC